MNKEFVSYEEALALKELGFNEPCVGTYHNRGNGVKFTFGMFQHPKRNSQANTVSGTFIGERGCYAPTYSQAFRWFRKKYGYDYSIMKYTPTSYRFNIEKLDVDDEKEYKHISERFDVYEEAELACLRKLLEIVKQNKDENKKR